jgi:hypothetical protein
LVKKLGYFREIISISIAFLQLLSHLIFIIRIAGNGDELVDLIAENDDSQRLMRNTGEYVRSSNQSFNPFPLRSGGNQALETDALRATAQRRIVCKGEHDGITKNIRWF